MSEYKSFLLFGKDGVSIFGSLYLLSVGFLFDKREDLATWTHVSTIKIISRIKYGVIMSVYSKTTNLEQHLYYNTSYSWKQIQHTGINLLPLLTKDRLISQQTEIVR